MELNKYLDQQRRGLLGEAPDSMESAMMRALLGDKPRQQGLVPYEGVARTHDHVNELQVGRSLGHHVLADMVEARVSISTLLPFQDVDPSVSYFEWTIERWRPGILPIVPEEAPYSELTYAVEPRYTKLQRRGAAVRMTADIMDTTQGMARLQSQILKLGATVLLTVEHLMVQTLVTAHDGPMYRRKMTLDRYGDRQIEDQVDYDAARFATWNKNPEVEPGTDMSAVGSALGEFTNGPYALLYPTGRQAVLGGIPIETPTGMEIKTMDAQKRVLQFESPKSNMRMADGSLAFPVPDYSFGRGSRRMQPLLRSTMIGEHYHMTGVECDDRSYRTGADDMPGGGFSTCQRDVLIYDTPQDQYEKVPYDVAFQHTGWVPDFAGENDPIAEFVGVASTLRDTDFLGPNRKAPCRVHWENGPKPVTVFAEFDDNVVPAAIHRRVGNTIAGVVQAAAGSDISEALGAGTALLRELVNAPFDSAVTKALNDALPDASTYATEAPDLAATYGTGIIPVYPQDPDGAIRLTPGQATVELMTAIEASGTPPFMASLGGLRLLARLALTGGAGSRVLDLGTRARNLLDAAEKIYNTLKDKFPQAVALDPRFRPLNHMSADGFATFFAAVFLNSGNLPLLIGNVVTPFVWTRGLIAGVANYTPGNDSQDTQDAVASLARGTSDNPVEPGGGGGPILTAGASVKAHAKTPWAAQHFPFAAARAQRGLRGGAARRQRRHQQQRGSGEVSEDDDLFGITPTFQQSQPAGAPLDGTANRDLTRLAAPVGGVFGPSIGSAMTSRNAKNAWNAADGIDQPLVRVCTMVYLSAPCGEMIDYRRMMDAKILVPFDILLVRPALELDMYSLIVMKPGLDTGFHAVANTNLDFGKDVDHQTRKISFSITHGTVLKAPDHVAILPSRMARRYVCGGGTRLYDTPNQLDLPGDQRPDLIAFVVPMDHRVRRREPAGGIDIDGLHGEAGSSRFPDAEMYERMWSLSEQAMATRQHGQRYYMAPRVIPDYTWRGEQLNWNRSIRYPAQGHRRGASHPGCLDVWNGNKSVFPPEPSFATVIS